MENNPRRLYSPTVSIATLLVLVIAAVAIFFIATYFIYSKKPSLARLSTELSGISEEEAYYRGLKKTISDTRAEQEALNSFFIDPDNFVSFVEEIEALGTRAGVALTVESAALTDNDRNLALTLNTGGTFGETLYFLSLLEAYPAKITFDRAWIAKSIAAKGQASFLKPWDGKFTVRFASN